MVAFSNPHSTKNPWLWTCEKSLLGLNFSYIFIVVNFSKKINVANIWGKFFSACILCLLFEGIVLEIFYSTGWSTTNSDYNLKNSRADTAYDDEDRVCNV